MINQTHTYKSYGNTRTDLWRASLGGGMLGLLAGIALGASFYQDHRLAQDWPAAVILGLVAALAIPLVVLPTCLFSIRIDEQQITHLFLGRIILKQCPVSQLKSMRVGLGLFGVVFQFTDGSRIHFPGARMRTIEALCGHIHQLLPNFQGFSFGTKYLYISSILHKFNPNP